MKYCNPLQDISAYLCDIPSPWRDAIAEALACALNSVMHANLDVEANGNCESIQDCQTVTSLITTIENDIVTIKYVDERNITNIRNTDLTDAINNALDNVDPKCLMTQEEWDALTYQERLSAIFDKVCCVHGNCTGSSGSGCGCDDCGDEDVECIGLEACPCVTYEVTGTAPFTFSYKDCDTKEITEFNSIDDNVVQVCAIRGTVIAPDGVFCNEILDECSDVPLTTTTSTTTTSTTTSSTTTSSTTTTTSTSTTTTTTIVPPPTTTTTSTSTTTTTTIIPPPPTTTTTTSTSTTSTTTAAPGVAIMDGIYSNNLGTHCAQPVNTIYTDDGTIVPGKTIYLDSALTNPLTGFTFISDDSVTIVYNLNSVSGVVGSNTGMSC